jgi:hypothetical protein
MDNVTLGILFTLIFVLMSFALFVMIRYGSGNKWLYFLTPFILWMALATYPTVQSALGYPIYTDHINDEIYLEHMVSIDQEWIYVWAFNPHDVAYIPRAYKIVYSEEDEKKLAEAKEKKGNGMPQGISFAERPEGVETEYETMKIYHFDKMEGVSK